MNSPKEKLIPVTLLTGFLGSGKTTLLNHILKNKHGKRIAVIENEFGDIDIDSDLLIGKSDEIFEMKNGCICCSVRSDLIETLNRLLEKHQDFDHIIIESTGLASSGPLAQAFLIEDDLSKSLVLDGIITLVDSKHIHNNLNEHEVVWEQIAFSNIILLNKTDLVSEKELTDLEKKVRQINPTAKVFHTTHARVDLDQILNIGGFDIEKVLDIDSFSPHHHEPGKEISSVSLAFPGFVNPDRLKIWLQMLFFNRGNGCFPQQGYSKC